MRKMRVNLEREAHCGRNHEAHQESRGLLLVKGNELHLRRHKKFYPKIHLDLLNISRTQILKNHLLYVDQQKGSH
jgi:hypothetical protein